MSMPAATSGQAMPSAHADPFGVDAGDAVGGDSARISASTEETREVARLAVALAVVLLLFALLSVLIVVQTGDAATAAAGAVQITLAIVLLHARHALTHGRTQRGTVLLVVATLAMCLVMALIPPPVPALAAGPIMSVAFALSFLRGRRLKIALVAAWVVSVTTAIIVEFTPSSPDMPPEVAAASRVVTFAAIVGLVGLVLYRHRRRLEGAMTVAQATGEALRASEARYRTVVESVREVIFRVDEEGRWAFLNQAWEDLTGRAIADSIGQPVIDVIHPEDQAHHVALAQLIAAGELEEYSHELRLVGPQGTAIWVEVHGRPIHDDAGQRHGFTGTLTDITVRRELEERLVMQAFHDDLTGLANRALFKDRVEHALSRRSAGRRLVGLLFLDLDRFKTVNDSLGHTVGDGLLVAIAERLHSVLRPEDTIARLGGDEFAILVDDVSAPHEALDLAERISASFDAPFRLGEREISIRSSIGVVLASRGHQTADDLLRDADVAMYRAKVGGRGSYALFEPSMQAEIAARQDLESRLRQAVANERLTVAYQPIVDIPTGRIVAVEALARWADPELGDVPPSVFISSAEESGLILSLGRWVLRRACDDVAALRRGGGMAKDLRLSVNLSPRQIADRTVVEVILGALKESGLPPNALNLEITESLVLDCGEEGIEYLRVLREAGCGVSFDDFGTGFSSLGNLRSLPIDELKIDRSFVASMLKGGVDTAVVEAVVRLGKALDLVVVAEGVEDAATANRLAELGCPLGQGYFFARPEPFAALAARLAGSSASAA